MIRVARTASDQTKELTGSRSDTLTTLPCNPDCSLAVPLGPSSMASVLPVRPSSDALFFHIVY